jgi:hypothetical protein
LSSYEVSLETGSEYKRIVRGSPVTKWARCLRPLVTFSNGL